jgi:hypothetical protein
MQLLRHLWLHAAVYEKRCRGVHWISWMTYIHTFIVSLIHCPNPDRI